MTDTNTDTYIEDSRGFPNGFLSGGRIYLNTTNITINNNINLDIKNPPNKAYISSSQSGSELWNSRKGNIQYTGFTNPSIIVNGVIDLDTLDEGYDSTTKIYSDDYGAITEMVTSPVFIQGQFKITPWLLWKIGADPITWYLYDDRYFRHLGYNRRGEDGRLTTYSRGARNPLVANSDLSDYKGIPVVVKSIQITERTDNIINFSITFIEDKV